MPSKSVREMSRRERRHYSLSARTFRSLMLVMLIISVAAIVFGFLLFTATVNREYRTEAWHLSQMAVDRLDKRAIRREAEGSAGSASPASDKLQQLNKDISDLREQEQQMKAKWEGEKALLSKIQANKQQIEQLRGSLTGAQAITAQMARLERGTASVELAQERLAREELIENGNWYSYQLDNTPGISL